MAMYTASNCVAVDGLNQNGKVTLIYEKDSDAKIKVIYDDPNDNVTQKYVTSPTDIPNWSRCTGYRF